ncbi:class I SAM-dependent methyltransferase [Pontibacillus sp. HN14]|uniref:Class I SAM-dependent methyltransferase n=2 Tax=Bacillaceae TaxID=186817 RepID=A0ABY8V3X3_9BACI|nr:MULTISPECIES: class I SAM-dependent methyltransferase [Pontibacillus]MCD5322362.1 class I SAM-dependent methyltransferase [Pontibacillus sp. HN14]WIG00164.1 class I SAM-dependent methyltransferase [Pontibacillus chungwhensis]
MMNVKRDVQEQFGRNAERYVTSTTHAKGEDLSLMVEWLEPKRSWKVLDIATGGGHVANQLAPHVKGVIVSDLTKSMLQAAASFLSLHENIEAVLADAEDLPFLDHSFDVVTCRIAAHHFPNPDRFVQEVGRVLKPGGAFVLIDNVSPEDKKKEDFYNHFEKKRDHSHQRALPISEWEMLLERSNLTIKKQSLRKKTLPFHEWVCRMVEDEQEREEIHQLMVGADQELRDYYQMKVEKDRLQSFSIDEWMVFGTKA